MDKSPSCLLPDADAIHSLLGDMTPSPSKILDAFPLLARLLANLALERENRGTALALGKISCCLEHMSDAHKTISNADKWPTSYRRGLINEFSIHNFNN
jgi:hypothetical protein